MSKLDKVEKILSFAGSVFNLFSSVQEASSSSRVDKPSRYRVLRSDSTVGAAEKNIEKLLNLPRGSVQINNSNGRNSRSDKRIGSLRAQAK